MLKCDYEFYVSEHSIVLFLLWYFGKVNNINLYSSSSNGTSFAFFGKVYLNYWQHGFKLE